MRESWGNHRGIEGEIGKTLPTKSPTPSTSHIRRLYKVGSDGYSVGSEEFAM